LAYDITGDIHGQADKLEALLRTLGYRDTAGAWRHPERQAIFVCDFLDRGPAQVRPIDIARPPNGSPLVVYLFGAEPELSPERLAWVV